MPHVPANRGVNNQGDGMLFDRSQFTYRPESDSFRCPARKTVHCKQLHRADRTVPHAADCGACSMKPRYTQSPQRMLSLHMDDDALNRMHQRAIPALMRLRRSTVEHPFGTLKYRIFGHPRLLLRGLSGAKTEIGIAVMAYNSSAWSTSSEQPRSRKNSCQPDQKRTYAGTQNRNAPSRGAPPFPIQLRIK